MAMRVRQIWRYPVKSLLGEQLDVARVEAAGIEGDRRYAIFDVTTGEGLTARRCPQMLFATAIWRCDGAPRITLPDGSVAGDDEALSDWLGRRVQLRSSEWAGDRRYANPDDPEDEEADWGTFDGSPMAFHDSGVAKLSLVTTTTIASWESQRFRSNVLLDGEGEDDLLDSEVGLGTARLAVRLPLARCVMVTRPQPGIAKDVDVLRTIHRVRGGTLAVGADVLEPGEFRVGDTVRPAAADDVSEAGGAAPRRAG